MQIGMRLLAAALGVALLGATGRGDVDAYLDRLVADWDARQTQATRFRISSEPAIAAMVVWDDAGDRVFPPPGGLNHISEERMLSDLDRLNALRAIANPTAWEATAAGAPSYYRCGALTCLHVDGPTVMSALGADPGRHALLLKPRAAPPLAWVGAGVALVLTGGAVWLRRGRPAPTAAPVPAAQGDPDSFLFGHVRIDPNRMTATIGPHRSELTARDLKLIGYFRDNAGSVLSKDQLYDLGWGRDYLPNSRALEQYILTLRRKLNPNRDGPDLIETVHGRGYRFND